MATTAETDRAREEESINKEDDDIEGIMGKAMEAARTFKEVAHKMKEYTDAAGERHT